MALVELLQRLVYYLTLGFAATDQRTFTLTSVTIASDVNLNI